MSKKPKRSRHNVPASYFTTPDEITPEYQAEIDATMAKAEHEYQKAQKRVEATLRRKDRALARKERAERRAANAAEKKKAAAEYERRLDEYESAFYEFKRMEAMVTGYPIRDHSRKKERVFVTGGRENPRAAAVHDGLEDLGRKQ